MAEQTSRFQGQQIARTRWNTHASGAEFDKKKVPYLTEQAQVFIGQRAFCVIAATGRWGELDGSLAFGNAGFVRALDARTCLLELGEQFGATQLMRGLRITLQSGGTSQLALFFINHVTRERLCIHGIARLLPERAIDAPHSPAANSGFRLSLSVHQAFFHCQKYIRTRVEGLSAPVASEQVVDHSPHDLQALKIGALSSRLTSALRHFIVRQRLCYICTANAEGQCAINHRGGAPGFLVTLPPDAGAPRGWVLLPDYAGNGAFEALGNILETGQAALVIPDFAQYQALTILGTVSILEPNLLSAALRRSCPGAQRILALAVQHINLQSGDWNAPLAYEQACAAETLAERRARLACSL